MGGINFFDSDDKKKIILNRLLQAQEKFGFLLFAYSIISNHYHYLIQLQKNTSLGEVEKIIAGGSSYDLNKELRIKQRVWDNYCERIVEENFSMEKVWGYILGNLLKHNEAKNFDDLSNSLFCSYKQAVKNYGKEVIDDLILSVGALELESKNNYECFFKAG